MNLKDLITRSIEVIDSDASLKEAAKKMQLLNVGALPVSKNGHIVGMITDRDIIVQAIANDLELESTKAKDIMTSPVVSCFDDQNINDVVKLMEEKKVRRVVMLNRDKKLVGIISVSDIAIEDRFERLAGEVLKTVYEEIKAAAA